MKIHFINKKLIDVFLDMNTYPTGYEENCWLRLQKRGEHWTQIAGINIPKWKFKMIMEELQKCA
jgi:hypothetical protein